MLTYSFENKGKDSLYEYLYKQIKKDILSGILVPNEKLPSKRALAKHLSVSAITVENAYSQLLAEGYIYSKPRSGFYVSYIEGKRLPKEIYFSREEVHGKDPGEPRIDFVNNGIHVTNFPFSVWNRMSREIMSDWSEKLMVRSPSQGVWELRLAIAEYLYRFRGMMVSPEQIFVGAGTEYLYGLLIQLLGRDQIYAVEDPGYQKISRIYEANQVKYVPIPLDSYGVNVELLEESKANILHISPSHHFPTGIVTPVNRRYEILSWASKEETRYVIEDDYDSEFRLSGKPIPTLQSVDMMEKTIYMNTFSKSLTATIRISYMVLPKQLMKRYHENLGFYSCTVSNFEQYTLAQFMKKGYLEKHINRMRNYYRMIRNEILKCIKMHPKYEQVKIQEEDAGLHFLLYVNTELSDQELMMRTKDAGIAISCLSQYYSIPENAREHTLILNYSGISRNKIQEAIEKLFSVLW